MRGSTIAENISSRYERFTSEFKGKAHLGTVKYVGKFIENMRVLAMGEEAKTIEHLIKLRDSSRTTKTSFVETALLKDEDDPNAAAADEPDKKLTVSTPPALAGGDGTFQYFAKLGG